MVPSFEKRVRAFAIDTSGVMLFIILALPFSTQHIYLAYGIAIAAFIGFYVFPHFLTPGQTFGKRIQKIKIVDLDGNPVKLWVVLLRDVLRVILSILTFGAYLIIAFFVMNEKTSRTIHDYVFKTKVIDLEKPQGKNNYLNKTESMRKRGL
ncbi:MAG: RDD family protein [Acholeplasmataceae bacterium]|nr:RDD family protein [Acholeplasmataceae bacterium]